MCTLKQQNRSYLITLKRGTGKRLSGHKIIFSLALATLGILAHLPGQSPNPIFRKKETRAVVVGISDYLEVDDLSYAHRDAEAFADYLRSPAGGSVPEENISLLLNEKATRGSVVKALYLLLKNSHPGDRAIIYFAGHGDVETISESNQKGYLLAYDASSTAYVIGGALEVSDLQNIITGLAQDKKAEVVLISDACRAGQLAGNEIRGNMVTSEQLARFNDNVSKILSCESEQVSLENEIWGGGHGVFSYHLTRGLVGRADKNNDEAISLREIRDYLEENVARATGDKQMPRTAGNNSKNIFYFDREVLASILLEESSDPVRSDFAATERGRSPKTPDKSDCEKCKAFEKALADNHLLYPEAGAAYTIFRELKSENKIAAARLEEMSDDLAVALQDNVQLVLNAYLKTSPEELEQRWSHNEIYSYYPEYLSVAADLLGPGHVLYDDLRTRQLYFEGLELRLEAEKNKDKKLLAQAMDKQQAVLEKDATASYAYNEIGLLLRRLRREKEATAYFEKANLYAPTWVLPMVNQVANYVDIGALEEARAMAERAIALDSTFALAFHNLGYVYERSGEQEKAIKAYFKAMELNPGYGKTYYNLGSISLSREDYPATEQYWLQFAERQNEPTAFIWSNLGAVAEMQRKTEAARSYLEKALEIDPDFANAYYNLGEHHLHTGEISAARAAIAKYREKAPSESDAYYLLAAVELKAGNAALAMQHLKTAFKQGFKSADQILAEGYFESLQGKKEFDQLLEKMRK